MMGMKKVGQEELGKAPGLLKQAKRQKSLRLTKIEQVVD